jgi:hypothetical protein
LEKNASPLACFPHFLTTLSFLYYNQASLCFSGKNMAAQGHQTRIFLLRAARTTISEMSLLLRKFFHHEGHEEHEEKQSSWIFQNFVLFVLFVVKLDCGSPRWVYL